MQLNVFSSASRYCFIVSSKTVKFTRMLQTKFICVSLLRVEGKCTVPKIKTLYVEYYYLNLVRLLWYKELIYILVYQEFQIKIRLVKHKKSEQKRDWSEKTFASGSSEALKTVMKVTHIFRTSKLKGK